MADETDQAFEYEHYLEYRSELVRGLDESHNQYDRALLSLSSGALVLSIAFLKDIVKTPDPTSIFLLKASWICFVAVIILTVMSFLMSQKAFNKKIENAGQAYKDQNLEILKEPHRWVGATKIVNLFSGFAFAVAVILTACFAIFSV